MSKNLFDFGDISMDEETANKPEFENVEEKINPEIKEKYDTYKDMDKSELETELEKEVRKQKENGTFNYFELKATLERLKPYMPSSDFNNIEAMLEKLK